MADERKARWLEGTYGKAVRKGAERRARFETTSGIGREPVYCPGAVASEKPTSSACIASSDVVSVSKATIPASRASASHACSRATSRTAS